MPSNSQLMGKLARGETLDMGEVQQLERALDGYDKLTNIVQNYTSLGGNQLNIPSAFNVIYSETLTVDTASLTIPIPSGYKHLQIKGKGQITSNSGGNIWCQFNGDTGSNYSWTLIAGNGTSASSSQDASDVYAALGLFSNTNDPAGSASSFIAEIMNYNAAYHQMVLAATYYNDNATRTLYQIGSKWSNTSAITSIEIFGTDSTLAKGSTNMAAGSVISVYGVI